MAQNISGACNFGMHAACDTTVRYDPGPYAREGFIEWVPCECDCHPRKRPTPPFPHLLDALQSCPECGEYEHVCRCGLA